MLMYSFNNKKSVPLYKNIFCVNFLFLFGGYLSLSFLGVENKSVRVVSVILISSIFMLYGKNIPTYIYKDSLIKNVLFYVLFCFPSILFSDDFLQCAFKLLEIVNLPLFFVFGVIYFNVKTFNNLFFFLLCYFVLQTTIAIYGFFFDPTVVAEETNYGQYVTFLMCKYPPLHANGLGSFGVVSALFSLTCCVNYKRHKLLKYFCFFLLIMSIAMVYLTSSRTSMISGFIAFVFLFIRIYSAPKKLLIVLLIIGVYVLYGNEINSMAKSIMMKKQNEETLSKSDDMANTLSSGRLFIWRNVLENPEYLILGRGYGTAVKSSADKIGAHNAHNSLMELLYCVGIIPVFFWLRMWWLIFRRYKWLCVNANILPYHVIWYHLSAAICLMAFIRSFGNISFVYLQLDVFGPLLAMILFVYTTMHIKKIKKAR